MRHLLPLLPRPSHFAGCEHGAVSKDPDTVSVRLALAFPDLYEVGMSYTGMMLLYEAVNRHDDLWAERVFAPSREAAEVLTGHAAPLCTLESDTPLGEMDAVGFHITHELCYTNILYMLDLAGIPLRTEERGDDDPLVMAGGGVTFNAEPMAPFLDVMVLGDGEEVLLDILRELERAKAVSTPRRELLRQLARIPGVYVPSLFAEENGRIVPLDDGYARVEKRVLADLNDAPYPLDPPQPVGAVHDRYTIELARGCTRGCRFCHAGMVYRPVRERSLDSLDRILGQGLDASGYGEISFLSLSTGDFSALSGLFQRSVARCAAEQVSISLPSLRVGSVSEDIARQIASIRRTGATLAPEAGSQRLRDVINKGVTEQELLDHTAMLFRHGWSAVKLYFMIGLPTETEEDVDAILDLCLKVRETAIQARGHKGRLQVTAAISPFVPKPHTPFQWEEQLGFEALRERMASIREKFSAHRKLTLRWHEPDMSWLEGVFSRAGRELAPSVELAYRKGALFSSWRDHLDLALWKEAFDELDVDGDAYLAARDTDAPLPWDHLDCGVSKRFLLVERKRALEARTTADCRFDECRNCGVCNHDGRRSSLESQARDMSIRPVVNLSSRDQAPIAAMAEGDPESSPRAPSRPDKGELAEKKGHYRIWYSKMGPGAWLSQLELQTIIERALRRAGLAMAFSQGFHPLPLISFGRALSVGVSSRAEYFDIYLRENLSAAQVREQLPAALAPGLDIKAVDKLTMSKKQPQAVAEEFTLHFTDALSEQERRHALEQLKAFMGQERAIWGRETRKGYREMDVRPLVKTMEFREGDSVFLVLDWSATYVSPLSLIRVACPELELDAFTLVKERQLFTPA